MSRVLKGHTDWVRSVHANGRHIVSGSRDKTVRIWSLADGKLLRTLKGHTDYVNSVQLTPDGAHVVSGSDDTTIRIWRAADGSCLRTLKGHNACVNSVDVTADGAHVISGEGREVRKSLFANGSLVCKLSGHTSLVLSVHATADGQHIVSGSADKSIRITPTGLPAIAAPAAASASAADDEVSFAGERTREQRDAEGRKRAIDLDGGESSAAAAAKAPRTAASSSSSSTSLVPAAAATAASSAAAASSSSAGVPGLDAIDGLSSLVAGLPSHIQAAAVKWCEDDEAYSVSLIIEAENDDAFVSALSLKPGGTSEITVRKRLAKARAELAQAQ